ncbi:DUF2931 family protein [Hymenobacter nivis]|nr:DUF2931 family protein [Hymenobacter nivis]
MLASPTEMFALSASPCAAEGYPMKIYAGAFVRADGLTFPVPSGHFLLGSWGASSIGWAVGEERQPVPASLDLLYFSYAEDTFYAGHFPLAQQRLYELLKTGFWHADKKQQLTYTTLTVCVLPKGMVCLWLTGIGKQVLVGRFQGSASAVEFKQFNKTGSRAQVIREEQAKLSPAVRHQLATGTISTRQWEDYLRTYSWHVAFSRPITLDNYRVNFLSAEYVARPDARDTAPYVRALLHPTARAVPSRMSLYIRDEAGHAHLLRTTAFDEAETMAAFAALHNQHPTRPLTLRVETDQYVTKASLVLTNGLQTIPLAKTAVEVLAQD